MDAIHTHIAASTDEIIRKEGLEMVIIQWVAFFYLMSGVFGLVWFVVRLGLFEQDNVPRAVVIFLGLLLSMFLCSMVYMAFDGIYRTAVLVMQRLPDRLLALKSYMRSTLQDKDYHNHVAVSVVASCCFFFLSAFFFWCLNELVIAKILMAPGRSYFQPYSFASFFFISALCTMPFVGCLSVAIMCVAGRHIIYAVRIRLVAARAAAAAGISV